MLDLPHITTTAVHETDTHYIITATENPKSIACTHCGTGKFRRYGYKIRSYVDIPRQGKPVRIELKRQRYHCRSCGRTYYANIDELSEMHRCTKRTIEYIRNQSLSSRKIARIVGISKSTAHSIISGED